MAFTEAQLTELNRPLSSSAVKQRSQSGRSLSYIEGYHAINEANRIFGFGEWDNQVIALTPVVTATQGEPNYQGSSSKGYLVAYIATVRVTVRMADGTTQTHEDVGYGEGIDYKNVGQAHESATKEAVTDALKRCLKDWGNPFGLALYDKQQRNVEDDQANGNGRPRSNGGSQPNGQSQNTRRNGSANGNAKTQQDPQSNGSDLADRLKAAVESSSQKAVADGAGVGIASVAKLMSGLDIPDEDRRKIEAFLSGNASAAGGNGSTDDNAALRRAYFKSATSALGVDSDTAKAYAKWKASDWLARDVESFNDIPAKTVSKLIDYIQGAAPDKLTREVRTMRHDMGIPDDVPTGEEAPVEQPALMSVN